jgi:hypothetical protein
MRFLKKLLLTIGLILLLACLKIVFKRSLSSSQIFYYNLCSSLQLLLLIWVITTGLLENTILKKEPYEKSRIKSSLFFIVLIALSELSCYALDHNPQLIPEKLTSSFREYYNNYQRDILQYNKNISRYDTALFYRMKSNNRSLFRNIEFSDSVFTNGLGFRNDELSVKKPKIICLGDSYTLGWGVQQEEAYPQQLEKILKIPVLNTGMASYGTAREIESVRQLDTTNLTSLVIQYCYNDADENETYIKNNYRLPISSRSLYDSSADLVKWSRVYFPGKYFCTLFKIFLNEKLHFSGAGSPAKKKPDPAEQPANYDNNASSFIKILRAARLNFVKIHLFIFDIGEYYNLNDRFVLALENQLNTPENVSFFKGHIHVLHISSLLTPSDYYLLDGHIKASGHRKIAGYLADLIKTFQP